MSCSCGSQGVLTTIAMVENSGDDEEPAVFDDGATRFDFVAENIGLKEWIVGDQGLTGSLDLSIDHIRNGPAFVTGQLMMNVSAKELDFLLPYILRGTKSSNDHLPGVNGKAMDIMIKRDKAVFVYRGLQVDKALFRANSSLGQEEPSLVELMLTFIGKDEDAAQGEWPDPEPARDAEGVLYWLMADSTLTLGGSARPFEAFNLMIDNMLSPLMRNSLRPTCIRSEGRRVSFQPRLTLCEESADDLYFTRPTGAGSLGFASSKYLGNSDSSTIFTFYNLYGRKRTPSTRGRTETFLDLDLTVYPGDDPVTEPVVRVTNTFPAGA
jgi:hypothetical protein